jgi:hypothetical protein
LQLGLVDDELAGLRTKSIVEGNNHQGISIASLFHDDPFSSVDGIDTDELSLKKKVSRKSEKKGKKRKG